jgi:predicted N-acetyltransferase YhbS
MATYRILEPAEYPEAITLWAKVFDIEEAFFSTLVDGGTPEENISVAAIENGQIVSSVHVFVRHIYDCDGKLRKVGGIGSVSTHDDHRKQGHSAALLKLAIEEMEKAGCDWSYLGTGKNDHYARHGYRTVSTRSFRGQLGEVPKIEFGQVAVVSDDFLAAMAPIHDAAHTGRPMAHHRSTLAWQYAIRYRLTQTGMEVHVDSASPNCYLVTRRLDNAISFVDAAWTEGSEGVLADLATSVLYKAQAKGASTVEYDLPEDIGLRAVLDRVCTSVRPIESRAWMGLPIAGRMTWAEVGAVLTDSRGRRCDLDNF